MSSEFSNLAIEPEPSKGKFSIALDWVRANRAIIIGVVVTLLIIVTILLILLLTDTMRISRFATDPVATGVATGVLVGTLATSPNGIMSNDPLKSGAATGVVVGLATGDAGTGAAAGVGAALGTYAANEHEKGNDGPAIALGVFCGFLLIVIGGLAYLGSEK